MKRLKTRTFIVSVVLLISMCANSSAQGLPVYDNSNFISLVKQLFESAKQTAEMIKTVQFLQDAKEAIEKVNNAVQQYEAVKEINANNEALVTMVRNDLREILNSPYIHPHEIDAISNAFNSIIDGALNNLEFMQQVLSNDFLKMTDAERLAILESHRDESKKMVADITLKNKRYQLIISFREMQDRIDHRETNY